MATRVLVVIFIVSCLLSPSVRAGDDPFAGKWQLNLQKSKFPGKPPLREDFTYEFLENGEIKFTVEEVRDSGTVTAWYTARLDGRDYPVYGAPGRDAVSVVRLGPNIMVGSYKNAGKILYVYVRFLSEDGKTMTTRAVSPDPAAGSNSVLIVHQRH
ncbi:MAG: hypothetical protein HY645_12810 [Acidobacteria bacterium]|nr:hypothetical protein [Acidobacteriota bacterium]